MTTIQVHIINAFVDAGRGGNPAGVVLNADPLSADMKQAIAAKVGYSETAFVSQSATADFKLDFFTPNRQIAHCGHATIATFSYLAQQELIPANQTSKETIDGNRRIIIDGALAFMEQLAPRYTELNETDQANVLKSVGLKADQLLPGHKPLIVNTGNSFMLIPVADQTILRTMQPNHQAIEAISDQFDLIGYYAFSRQTQQPDRAATTRMFAPRYGIPEEAATGMAAGPLACYLYDDLDLKQAEITIEQGHFMTPPSPSELIARLALVDGKITSLMVGGQGVVVKTMTIDL